MDQRNPKQTNRDGSQDRPMLNRGASQAGFNQPFITFAKDFDVNSNDHTGILTSFEVPDNSGPSRASSSPGTKQQTSSFTHSERAWASKTPDQLAHPDNRPAFNLNSNSDPLTKWLSETPTDSPYHAIDRVMDDDDRAGHSTRASSNTAGVRRSAIVEPVVLKGSGKRHR